MKFSFPMFAESGCLVYSFVGAIMKKSLILVSIMFAATTLFAEFKAFHCETDLGLCTYEQNENYYCEYCTCAEGIGYAARNCGNFEAPLPTVEECFAQIDNTCKNTEFRCENNAGKCFIAEDGVYVCQCFGVWSANGASEGAYYGTVNRSEESCKNKLVEICGTEPATVKDVCENSEILNECIEFIKSVDACYGREWPDENNEAILDHPADGSGSVYAKISSCCQEENYRKELQPRGKCLESCKEEDENSTEEDCCKACGFHMGYDNDDISSEESDSNSADANTEAPTTGTTPEDTDGDSSAPAENKEENKSDGCLMLFV